MKFPFWKIPLQYQAVKLQGCRISVSSFLVEKTSIETIETWAPCIATSATPNGGGDCKGILPQMGEQIPPDEAF